MNLFTDVQKSGLAQNIDNIHDTFATNLTYYLERDILTVSSDSNFNYIYQNEQAGVTVTSQMHSGAFSARIHFFNPSDNRQGYQNFPVNKLNIDNTKTYLRIRTKLDNLSLVQGIKYLKLDGLTYELESAPKPHSLFPNTTKYVDIVFSSVK